MIYVLSAHTADGRKSRCFGYRGTLTAARVDAMTDSGSMSECLYSWLCIERVEQGVHPVAEVMDWYQWNDALKRWDLVNTGPEWARGVTNLAGVG